MGVQVTESARTDGCGSTYVYYNEKYNQLEHEKNLLFETASGHKCTCFHLIPYGKCSLDSKDV